MNCILLIKSFVINKVTKKISYMYVCMYVYKYSIFIVYDKGWLDGAFVTLGN